MYAGNSRPVLLTELPDKENPTSGLSMARLNPIKPAAGVRGNTSSFLHEANINNEQSSAKKGRREEPKTNITLFIILRFQRFINDDGLLKK